MLFLWYNNRQFLWERKNNIIYIYNIIRRGEVDMIILIPVLLITLLFIYSLCKVSSECSKVEEEIYREDDI